MSQIIYKLESVIVVLKKWLEGRFISQIHFKPYGSVVVAFEATDAEHSLYLRNATTYLHIEGPFVIDSTRLGPDFLTIDPSALGGSLTAAECTKSLALILLNGQTVSKANLSSDGSLIVVLNDGSVLKAHPDETYIADEMPSWILCLNPEEPFPPIFEERIEGGQLNPWVALFDASREELLG